MAFTRKQAEETFENFLMIMDDQLENLKGTAEKNQIPLDYSLRDLENLEKLFDIVSKDLPKDELSKMVVFFARYLGELMINRNGGKWTIPLDNEKNINFNTPVITGHSPIDGLEFAPISTMRAYALRRKKGTLRRSYDANVNPIAVDIDHLIEE
ncbi:hypothetical protein O59_001045 [Cellvibrio sp. BR]|uniref:hypothetical protein n=1 Tax=Cellvibrio sp. BR TaxID=1134474 RepID=UPI0002600CBB|nr:hypothetical protein [Cellvibrio sp. BR]EIK47024.1 hypothetical protein O59_001045 [Cellvibrio sp. BR]